MPHSLKRLIIAGGSGFLGSALARHFTSRAAEIIILTRHPQPARDNIHFVAWDGRNPGGWQKYFCDADAVINLTGRSVNCRYNAANQREIIDSRVNATRLVGESIADCDHPPPLWMNASSATFYAPSYDEDRTEDSPLDPHGFSENVCRQWEDAFFNAAVPGVRKVALRTTFVLGPPPCASFAAFKDLVKKGLGGSMAGGQHYVGWMHEDDFCRAVEWVITHPALQGPINMAAPHPLTNAEFMRAIRQTLNVPFGLPMPRWMLELGAFFMRTETELILKSRKVVPQKLLNSGFTFEYPTWAEAVKTLV